MDRERLTQPVTAIRALAQFALLTLARQSNDDHTDVTATLDTIVAETRRLETLLAVPTLPDPLATRPGKARTMDRFGIPVTTCTPGDRARILADAPRRSVVGTRTTAPGRVPLGPPRARPLHVPGG